MDPEHMLTLLYAGQGGEFYRGNQGSGCREETDECPAWSAVTSQQPREAHVQMGRLRRKGVRSLFQDHPVKAKALGRTVAPTHDLCGLVPQGH